MKRFQIVYKINKNENSKKIFDPIFIKNNKNNCRIISDNKIFLLNSKLTFLERKSTKLKIELLILDNYNRLNLRRMFYGIKSLIKFSDIKEKTIKSIYYLEVKDDQKAYITKKINDLQNLFKDKNNLSHLSYKYYDIIVTDMSYMFYECSSLISLPDLSNWNTNNVKNMSYMFYKCKSLTSLPDISKWYISNVENISYMFYKCESLTTLPDLSKWNIYYTNIDYLFNGCTSLYFLPNILTWQFYDPNLSILGGLNIDGSSSSSSSSSSSIFFASNL